MQEIDIKPGISQLIIVQRGAQQPTRWAQTRRTEEVVGKPTQVNSGGSANATSQQKERACTMESETPAEEPFHNILSVALPPLPAKSPTSDRIPGRLSSDGSWGSARATAGGSRSC